MNTTQKELIAKMNANREAINQIEDEDDLLGKELLSSIVDEQSCWEILSALRDSTTRLYVADKLRMLLGVYKK